MNNKRFVHWVLLCLVVMIAASLPGVYERLFVGHDATQTPQPVPWGLWVAAYTFFSGISAGAFTVVAMPYVFGFKRFKPLAPFAILLALLALAAALIYVMADLGRPERSFHIFLRWNAHSMMAWVITLYTFYGTVLLVLLGLSLRPAWFERATSGGGRIARWLALGFDGSPKSIRRNDLALKVFGFAGLACALGLAGGVGALFSVLGSRGLWHSALFPITFTVSALLSGIAFVLGSATLLGEGGEAFKQTLLLLARMVGYLLVGEIFILSAEALIIINGGIPAHLHVVRAIGAGPYAWVFWGLQVGLGIVAALLLIFLPRKPSLAAAAIASLFVLVGVYAFRLNFVIPELAMGEFAVSDDPTHLYVPNAAEWELVMFGVGLVGVLLLAARRWLPLFPTNAPLEFERAARESEPFVTGFVAEES